MESKEPVPPGHIASIITHLEMTERQGRRPLPDAPLSLRKCRDMTISDYKTLFRLVGAPWLWFSRLCQSDEELAGLLAHPEMALFVIEDRKGESAGILELDFRVAGACEIVYLGLVPALNGKGFGQWLMAHALALAWAGPKTLQPVERVWLRTCTLDHPAALPFYRKHGFVPLAQEIEVYPDPRLSGQLPENSAPQIPLLRP